MKNWLSEVTQQLIRLKRLCYRKSKKFFSFSCQHQYSQLRNKVRAATRFDFKAFVDSITEGLYQSSKPFWNQVNKIRACRNPLPTINHKDQVITSDTAKANLFYQSFTSVFTNEDISLQNSGF